MEETILGFDIRFEGQSEHIIVLEHQQEMRREDLSELQLRMLETGRIPGVLPVHVYELDHRVRLQYAISDRSMLYYALRLREPDEKDLLRFLLSVVTIIGNSLEYMLHDNGYLLHERLIFVGERWDEAYLIFMPATVGDLQSLRVQFVHVVDVLVDCIGQREKGGNVRLLAIKRYCEQPEWTWRGLKQKLEETETPSERQAVPMKEEPSELLGPTVRTARTARTEVPFPFHPFESNGIEPIEIKSESAPSLKNKMILFAAILIAALVCIYGAAAGSKQPVYIGVGALFVMAAAIVFILPAGKIKSLLQKDDDDDDEEGLFMFNRPIDSLVSEDLSERDRSLNERVDLAEYYRLLGDRTALLPQQEAAMLTVALDVQSVQSASNSAKKPRPTLELWRNQVQERVQVDRDPFLIGRKEAGVHLSIPAPDVSRVHAEICTDTAGIAIRDLKAKNGTTLNDTSLVPYEKYALHDGDIIGIGASKIVFKFSNA